MLIRQGKVNGHNFHCRAGYRAVVTGMRRLNARHNLLSFKRLRVSGGVLGRVARRLPQPNIE